MFWIIELMFRKLGRLIERYGGWEGLKQDLANFVMPFERLLTYIVLVMILALIMAVYPFGIDWLPQWDFRGMILSLAIFVNVVTLAFVFRIKSLVKLGMMAFGASRFDDERDFFNYIDLLRKFFVDLMFFVTTYLLVLGVASFRKDPGIVILIGAGLFGVLWQSIKYDTSSRWIGVIVRWIPFMVVMTGVVRLVLPNPYFVRFEDWTGWNPKDIIALSPKDYIRSDIKAINQGIRSQRYSRIGRDVSVYRRRIERGERLSEGDMVSYRALLKEYESLNSEYGAVSSLRDFSREIPEEPEQSLRVGVSFTDKLVEMDGSYYWEGVYELERQWRGVDMDTSLFGPELYTREELLEGDFIEFRPRNNDFEYDVYVGFDGGHKKYVQKGVSSLVVGVDVNLGWIRFTFPKDEVVNAKVYRKRMVGCADLRRCLLLRRVVTGGQKFGIIFGSVLDDSEKRMFGGHILTPALDANNEILLNQIVRFTPFGEFEYVMRKPLERIYKYTEASEFVHNLRTGYDAAESFDEFSKKYYFDYDINGFYLVMFAEGERMLVQVFGDVLYGPLFRSGGGGLRRLLTKPR